MTQTHERGGVTLLDVAREAGVHVSTVSRALSPRQHSRVNAATRRHILAVADRLGYRPDMVARGLKSGRTATVGVIVADLGNSFVTPIIHGLTSAVAAAGMMPMIAETEDGRDRLAGILDHMLSRRVDAMVVAGARTGDRQLLETAGRLVPIVVAGRPLDDTTLPQVVVDDELGGGLVAEHLITMGHTRVAQLRGPTDVANFPRRAHGFSQVSRGAGVDEITLPVTASRPVMEEGMRLMNQLLDSPSPLPTAVFAHNDLMALGAMSRLRGAGMTIPQDMALVGYNDLPMVGHLNPPLTTVEYPSMDVGRLAGEMMIDLLAGGSPENRVLQPRLIARASTAQT